MRVNNGILTAQSAILFEQAEHFEHYGYPAHIVQHLRARAFGLIAKAEPLRDIEERQSEALYAVVKIVDGIPQGLASFDLHPRGEAAERARGYKESELRKDQDCDGIHFAAARIEIIEETRR